MRETLLRLALITICAFIMVAGVAYILVFQSRNPNPTPSHAIAGVAPAAVAIALAGLLLGFLVQREDK